MSIARAGRRNPSLGMHFGLSAGQRESSSHVSPDGFGGAGVGGAGVGAGVGAGFGPGVGAGVGGVGVGGVGAGDGGVGVGDDPGVRVHWAAQRTAPAMFLS